MASVVLGVDLAAPPADLPERLASLKRLGATLLVTPLAHPRYRRDHTRPLDEPMTRSDLLLSSGVWGKHVVGRLSPWLEVDSPHAHIRRRSEEAFKQEVAWAAHLGLPALLLPPPPPDGPNYVRLVQWACASTQHMKLLVRVPIAAPPDDEDGDLATDERRARTTPASDPWACWDRLRTMCEQSSSLAVALELGLDLPARDAELERWGGEPVAMVIVPTSTFMPNKKGFPALSRRHQAALTRLMALRPQLVVSGREDGGRGTADSEGIGAHLQYLAFLVSKLPPVDERTRYEMPYFDYLQAPLQPLADDLESSTYETFEQDPIKYARYQEAVCKCLTEKHAPAPDGPVVIVMVLGAGRGPLVAASLAAAAEAGRAVRVYALDKNQNAVVTLRNRCRNEPLWAQHVTVVAGDMRAWAAPIAADIIVSELLGSWGDNELSPECLDGAMRYLKPGGVSIPSYYVSTVAPLSSSKLWNEVRGLRDLKHFETPYVVRIHNAWQMAPAQKAFSFDHPGEGWKDGWSESVPPPDNARFGTFSFECETGGRLHGFVGYFHADLYGDVHISIDPATESIGMFSWFPLYMPLRHPVLVPDGARVTVHFWRHVTSHKVWYEWSLHEPQTSPIHNPNGRSYHIGL